MKKILFFTLSIVLFNATISKAQTFFTDKNRKIGLKDDDGNIILPGKYDYDIGVGYPKFVEGMASVKLKGKYGYIDKTGTEIVVPKYSYAGYFIEGLASVGLDGRYGYIDKTGKEVVPLKYEYYFGYWGSGFSKEYAQVKLNGKYGLIDKSGREITPIKYEDVGWYQWSRTSIFSDGLAAVKLNNKWGLVDTTGREVIPTNYDEIYNFLHSADDAFPKGLIGVRINDSYGYVDAATGKELTPLKYSSVSPFVNGIAKVRAKGNNKVIILDRFFNESFILDNDYNSDYKRFIREGKTGVLNKEDQLVVPCVYDTIYTISQAEGLATAKNKADGKYIYLDLATGKPYDWALGEDVKTYQLPGGKITVYKHNLKARKPGLGIKDHEGKIMLYPVFTKIDVYSDKIVCEQGEMKSSFDVSALGLARINFKDNDHCLCTVCKGAGYTTRQVSVAASSKPLTTKTYSTGWERVWDTKTNSYKDVQKTIETTVTSNEYTKGYTSEEKIECSRCNGKGKFNYIIWNIVQFNYIPYAN